jgi:acetyl-CoA acyltransferase
MARSNGLGNGTLPINRVYVAGIGLTPFGKLENLSVKDLTRQAVTEALADAGSGSEPIGVAFFANATQGILEGQSVVRGQIALRAMGIHGVPIANVENACASGSTAFHLACVYVQSGIADVALAVGCEKMYSADKQKTFSVFSGGWDVHESNKIVARLLALGDGVSPPPGIKDQELKSVFLDVYAAIAKYHMKTFGLTERQLAIVASKNHAHSVFNPHSQYRHPMTVEEVLAAKTVAWPLTLPMCSPISDGAAAILLCSREALGRFPKSRPIKVLASVLASGVEREWGQFSQHIARRAAVQAYEQAGLSPEDMSVAEVHDATAFGEILQSECLGFCGVGEGGVLAESGATRLGGRIPINVSGGLESKGHPVGATGIAQICELTCQLRGESGTRQVPGARLAIAANGGGFYGVEEAAACVNILGK